MQQEKGENKFSLTNVLHILNMKYLTSDSQLKEFEFKLSNIQRNAYLTIYKEVQNESPSNLDQMIQNTITKMADQQRIVKKKSIERNEGEQFAIKSISTTNEIIPNLKNTLKEIQNLYHIQGDLVKNLETLIKYLIEIQERQSDGQINNALITIQLKKKNIKYNPMCAATSLFRCINVEEYKINQLRPIKMAYINLTLSDSVNNVQLWQQCSKNTKNMSAYFSIFINSEEESLKQYSRIPELYLFPIDQPKDNILSRMQLRTLFKNCIRIPLEIFNPQIIFLSLRFSYEKTKVQIDLQELQNVIRKLCQMSNNKLVIHVNFEDELDFTPNEEIENDFTQFINCIYQGMQFIRIPKQLEILSDQGDKILWLNKTSKYFQQFNLIENAKIFQRYANTLEVMKPKLRNEKKEIDFDFQEGKLQKFIGCHYKSKFVLFDVKYQHWQIFFNNYVKIFINHNDLILAIYDEQRKQAYYGDLSQLENSNTVNVEWIRKLPKLINPSLLIIQNQIIFAYGTVIINNNPEQFNESIYCFDIFKKKLVECKCKSINENQSPFMNLHLPSKKNQNLFDQKTQLKLIYDGEVQFKRQNPGVAKCSLFKNDRNTLNFMLIGGESTNGINQIQNVIECIQLNIEQQIYISGYIDKVCLHKFPTFKPFANQIILDSENQAGEKRFIILPGNLNMFSEYYKQPINQSYADKATLIVVSQKDNLNGLDISEVQIQYDSQNILNIPFTMLLNNQNSFDITQNDEDQITWVLYSSAIAYYPKLVKMKADMIYSHESRLGIQVEEKEQPEGESKLMQAQVIMLDPKANAQDEKIPQNQQEIKEYQKYMANSVVNQRLLQNYYFIIKFELNLKTNVLNIIETTIEDNSFLEIDTSQLIKTK